MALGLGLPMPGWAGPPIRVTPGGVPEPSAQVRDHWIDSLVGSREYWVFENLQHWSALLKDERLSNSDWIELAQLKPLAWKEFAPARDLDWFRFQRLHRWVEHDEVERVVVVTPELKAKLSPEALRQIYLDQVDGFRAPYHRRFQSRSEAEAALRSWGLTNEGFERFSASLLELQGKGLYLFFTPELMPHVTPKLREELGRRIQLPGASSLGIGALFKITRKDDLREVALALEGPEKNAAVIERYLRARLGNAPGGEVEIPLEKVLPRFVRRKLNRFEQCSTANCASAAKAVARPGVDPLEYESPRGFLEDLGSEFRMVASGEALRVGDVVAYFSGKTGKILHFCSYVGTDRGGRQVFFTKNGHSPTNPYLLQTRGAVERIYSRFEGKIRGVVFRYEGKSNDDGADYLPEKRVLELQRGKTLRRESLIFYDFSKAPMPTSARPEPAVSRLLDCLVDRLLSRSAD